MYSTTQLATELYKRIVAQKKISHLQVKQEDILYILQLIDCVNNLPWTACEFKGIPLDKIVIPACLGFKVMPSRVSFNVGSKYPDLRYTWDAPDVDLDLMRIINIADGIYGSVKMDTKLINLEQLRGVVDLNGVNFAVNIDGIWKVEGNYTSPFYPVPLKKEVSSIFGTHVVNETAEYVIKDFILQFKIS